MAIAVADIIVAALGPLVLGYVVYDTSYPT